MELPEPVPLGLAGPHIIMVLFLLAALRALGLLPFFEGEEVDGGVPGLLRDLLLKDCLQFPLEGLRLVLHFFVAQVTVLVELVHELAGREGKTPPMGWNAWYAYLCNINETIVQKTADFIVSSGLAAKGYKYICLDDCWQVARNSTTKEIIEEKAKFPSGMAALADYIHSKGLLFGIYSDSGT